MVKFLINHFNLNVIDLEKSLTFYDKHLGFKEIRRKEDPKGNYKIVWVSDELKKITIELTWLKDKEGAYDLGDNEFHIAVSTDNYDEAYKMHKEANIICYENPQMGIYFINDPDGYWIEIIPQK